MSRLAFCLLYCRMHVVNSNSQIFPALRSCVLTLFVFLLMFPLSCARDAGVKTGEIAYVAVPQAALRDRVAAVFSKTGVISNGEKVDVLERSHNGRWLRVRSLRGEEGWIEQRYLADQNVFNSFQKLASDNQHDPAQARATVQDDLNMHLEPSRDSDHLYQLKQGEKLELLKRATTAKAVPGENSTDSSKSPSPPLFEDWWLVRSPGGRYGWVLARMVDNDVPLEVAQYSEGQRIIADFVLDTVDDHGKSIPQYLLLFNESKDGSQADFNQARVFTWNLKMHRYETAYRERKLFGILPAKADKEDFGKEGTLPSFTLRLRGEDGKISERKYKLNGVMVRRVLSPEEAAQGKERKGTSPQRDRLKAKLTGSSSHGRRDEESSVRSQ